MAPPKEKRESILSSPYATAGAVALPAALTWLLLRRANYKGMTPKQREVAKLIQEKGIEVSGLPGRSIRKVPVLREILNYLQYGTTHASEKGWKAPGGPKVVYAPTAEVPRSRSGKIILGGAPRRAELSKIPEAKLLARVGELKAIAGSDLPGHILKIEDPVERLAAIRKELQRRFPQGYVFKNPYEWRSGTPVTNRANLEKTLVSFYKQKPTAAMPLKPGAQVADLTGKPAITRQQFERIRRLSYTKRRYLDLYHELINRLQGARELHTATRLLLNPEKVLIQERARIKRTGALDRLIGRLIRRPSGGVEFRVHAIGPQVIRGASISRHGTTPALAHLAGHYPEEVRLAEDHVENVLSKLPRGFVRNRAFAFDVAQTGKGFKIIESNPSGWSGLLTGESFNPAPALTMHRFISKLQGRPTGLLTAPKALAAGGLGYGGLAATKALTEES